jgi:hypothetical protein
VSLVGGDPEAAATESGKYHLTYHNYWRDISTRVPALRFSTARVFNNYYLQHPQRFVLPPSPLPHQKLTLPTFAAANKGTQHPSTLRRTGVDRGQRVPQRRRRHLYLRQGRPLRSLQTLASTASKYEPDGFANAPPPSL